MRLLLCRRQIRTIRNRWSCLREPDVRGETQPIGWRNKTNSPCLGPRKCPNGDSKDVTIAIQIQQPKSCMQNFLNKPDGGRGWASLFIQQGYEVYIIDQISRGRSAWRIGAGASLPTMYSAELIQQRFTAPQDYVLWPQAVNHTQWPGTGKMGDLIFDAFYSSEIQFISNDTYQQGAVQAAGAALLDRIGKPVVLLGHSQGGPMATVIADARPNLTEAIVLLEPMGQIGRAHV